MTEAGPDPIRSETDLDAALDREVAVLYKHSPLCGLSARAAVEVRSFMRERPEVPVYHVDVISDRSLSRLVAERLGVRHESPQALVLHDGEVTWHGSHRSVTASALGRATT